MRTSLAVDERGGPLGNDCRVGAVRILALAEHVEIAQADGIEAVGAREDRGIQLVGVLGDGIRRQRLSDAVFHFRQAGMVTVGRARRRVGEARHFGIAGGYQHVEKAADVDFVRRDRIIHRARHRAERGLVKHMIDAFHRVRTVLQAPDIAFDEAEAAPLLGRDERAHFVEVVLIAGREVVQSDDGLVELEQRFQQIGADEAGHAGDEPLLRAFCESLPYGVVAIGHRGSPIKTKRHRAGDGVAGGANGQATIYRRRSLDSAGKTYFRS